MNCSALVATIALTTFVMTANDDAAQTAPAESYKSMASSLGMIVFPAKGQTPEQQKKDDFDCFNWAKQNTGIDPLAPPPTPAPSPTPKKGGAVRGAARGAAAGAAIGAAAGDAGEGAAIGAAAGGAGGRRAQAKANKQAEAKAEGTAKTAQQQRIDTFKKGMAACFEGKGYTVK
ncbi:MAG: glycine zipper family protein [Thermoanaerobaculia bacterium]